MFKVVVRGMEADVDLSAPHLRPDFGGFYPFSQDRFMLTHIILRTHAHTHIHQHARTHEVITIPDHRRAERWEGEAQGSLASHRRVSKSSDAFSSLLFSSFLLYK